MAKEKEETRQPGVFLVGDKVNTPDGAGKIVEVTDTQISVDLDNKKKGIFKPGVVSLA